MLSELNIILPYYRELLFTALVLLSILLYNNFVLYKRKLRDHLSLMLLAAVVMCAYEIQSDYIDGERMGAAFTYADSCAFGMSLLVFSSNLNRYLLERFGRTLRRKWLSALFYVVPTIAFPLICLSMLWVSYVFPEAKNRDTAETILYITFLSIPTLAYLLSSLAMAVYHLLPRMRQSDPSAARTAKSLLLFAALVPATVLLQVVVLRDANVFWPSVSVPLAVALVYLTTNVSTHSLLETQAKVEAVETDLRIAAKIQTDALPPAVPEFADHPELQLRASMSTAREVGGDFYDYFAIDENHICFLIADVSGKGTPAALFMMTDKTVIKDYALTHGSTAEIFTAVNVRLCENNREGMFATAWIGIYDTGTHILQYTNAGHNYPVLQRRGEPCTLLKKKHGLFLAGMDDTEYRQSELQLNEGDRLLLYTDGITEAHDRSGGLYGTDRLTHVLEETADESGEKVLEGVISDVQRFSKGEPQFDDMTMLIVTIKE